jgi:hypothetical protein
VPAELVTAVLATPVAPLVTASLALAITPPELWVTVQVMLLKFEPADLIEKRKRLPSKQMYKI